MLREIGGFHPDNVPPKLQFLQGDGETAVTDGARTLGYSALYIPEARVEHVIPADRLTVQYFESRAFYLGVGESYRRVRVHETRRVSEEIRANLKTGLRTFLDRLPAARKAGIGKPSAPSQHSRNSVSPESARTNRNASCRLGQATRLLGLFPPRHRRPRPGQRRMSASRNSVDLRRRNLSLVDTYVSAPASVNWACSSG